MAPPPLHPLHFPLPLPASPHPPALPQGLGFADIWDVWVAEAPVGETAAAGGCSVYQRHQEQRIVG